MGNRFYTSHAKLDTPEEKEGVIDEMLRRCSPLIACNRGCINKSKKGVIPKDNPSIMLLQLSERLTCY